MIHQKEAQTISRLRHALLNFKQAQTFYLGAHRKLKSLSAGDVDAYWNGPGLRLELALHASAKEVMVAFALFSSAGLVASADDRHLVTEAKRSLEQDTA